MKIIYNHSESSGREENSTSRGVLHFHKEDRSFSCDASDLDCMGVKRLDREFDLQVEETGNIKPFVFSYSKTDDEGELQFDVYTSKDGRNKFFIWND